jgi:hypothetical protein
MPEEIAAAPAAAPAPAAPAPAPAAAAPAPAPAESPAPAPAPVAADWAADWRDKIGGTDEAFRKQLDRFGSPVEVAKSWRALQVKLSSGDLKPVLAKDAKPEEIAEYRKAHGIPEAADKYDLKDVKFDDGDKPFVAELLKSAHATNQTPEQVQANLKTWTQIKALAFEHQAESDRNTQTKAEDTLRAEWGAEYRLNRNLIDNLLNGSGDQKLKDQLLHGRLADGTPIGSSPAALKMLLGVALAANPTRTLVPGGDANPQLGLKEELDKIAKVRSENRAAYTKDDKMQARERDLINAAVSQGFMDSQGNWKK